MHTLKEIVATITCLTVIADKKFRLDFLLSPTPW